MGREGNEIHFRSRGYIFLANSILSYPFGGVFGQ